MQAFNPVHLQHLRSAFAILAEGIREDRCIEEDAKPLKQPAVVQANQSQQEINAKQFDSLIHTQESHTQGLQAIAIQLTELTELAKQLKSDSDFFSAAFSKNRASENLAAEKVEIAIESSSGFDFELPAIEVEIKQSCQAYFSRLPWSSEMFAAVATKMRESKPKAEIPQMMQLATDSALKTAAQAAALSKSDPEQESFLEVAFQEEATPTSENLFLASESEIRLDSSKQICVDYFPALPWTTETQVLLSKVSANTEQELPEKILLIDQVATDDLLSTLEPELQHSAPAQICANYFPGLPWAGETEVQLSAEYVNSQQDSAVDRLFLDESLPSEQIFFQNLEKEIQVTSQTQNCGSYFQALPWVVKKTVINDSFSDKADPNQAPLQKRKAMLEAIFATKAAITDQGFLNLLEQETETLSEPVPKSQDYFQTLPWG